MHPYGHAVIVTTPFTLLHFFFPANLINYISLVRLPLMYVYPMYCSKSCFRMDYTFILTKNLICIFALFKLVIASGIVGTLVGIVIKVTGVI
jgi:hypothetical protein